MSLADSDNASGRWTPNALTPLLVHLLYFRQGVGINTFAEAEARSTFNEALPHIRSHWTN
jgi:hypothetical protein